MLIHPKVIRWTFISAGMAGMITLILVMLMLIPALVDGPDGSHVLKRSKCQLTKIVYQDNYCLRDNSQDFSDLNYLEDWSVCKIAFFQIKTSLDTRNCTWIYPQSFEGETEAFVAISEHYREGQEYDCVVDTVKQICYPDKREVLVFSLSVGGLILVNLGILVAYIVVKTYFQEKEKKDY